MVPCLLVEFERLLLQLLHLQLVNLVNLFTQGLLETYPLIELLVLSLCQLLAQSLEFL